MPTYHYKCEQDGTMFELHQSIHDDPIEYCECGSRVSRVVFAPLIRFNGSGFYSTGQ